jgi:putative membrane protein
MKFSNAITLYRIPFRRNKLLLLCALLFLSFWLSTFIGTTDMANWFLENVLIFIFLAVLVATY